MTTTSTIDIIPTINTIAIPTTTDATTKEYLQWCIIWTMAYPVISSKLLSIHPMRTTTLSQQDNHYNNNTTNNCYLHHNKSHESQQQPQPQKLEQQGCTNTNRQDSHHHHHHQDHQDHYRNDFLWLSYIAFHCIWNGEPDNHSSYDHYHRTNCDTNRVAAAAAAAATLFTPPDTAAQPTHSCHQEETVWRKSLGYGEIKECSVFRILQYICQYQDGSLDHNNNVVPTTIRTVIDLGSGTGRVVLASALALLSQQQQHCVAPSSSSSLQSVIGLEIVLPLHRSALQRIQPQWNREQELLPKRHQPHQCEQVQSPQVNLYTSIDTNSTTLDFHCCDFTVHTDWWTQAVDLIWIHGTVFEEELWDQLYRIIMGRASTSSSSRRSGVKVGTWIVSISRPLLLQSPPPTTLPPTTLPPTRLPPTNMDSTAEDCRLYLQPISEMFVDMNWGQGIAYIQQVQVQQKNPIR
jgi:hypothetical protein